MTGGEYLSCAGAQENTSPGTLRTGRSRWSRTGYVHILTPRTRPTGQCTTGRISRHRNSYRGPRFFFLPYSQTSLYLNRTLHQTERWTNLNICYDLGCLQRNSNLNLPWLSPNHPHVLACYLLAVHLFDNYIPRALSLFPIFLAPNAGI